MLALTFPLAALGVQHQAILQRHMQFWRYGVVQILSTIVAAVAGVVLALLGWGYWSLILQSLLGLLAGTAVSWLVVRWLPGRPRRCADLREMLGFGGRLSAHGMVGYLSLNFDKMLLGRFCGALQLGLYATPYMLLGRLLSLSSYSVGQAAIPAMSRAEASADQMRQTYRRMLQLACLLGLPVCLMGLVWPRDMILTALGGHWIEATDVLWWLFVGGLPRLVGASTGWIWIATGRPGQMLRWEMVQSPLMAIAFVAGLPYGAKGVAMGFAVSSWILVVPGFAYCLRGSVLRAMDVIGPVLAPLACAAIGCLAGTLVQMAVAPDLKAGAARLAIRLAGAGLVYGIGASLCVPLVAEGLRKVRGKLSRAVVAAGTPLRGEDSRTGESGQ